MKAQSAIAAPYQMPIKGIMSLVQLNAWAAAPSPPATTPALAPHNLNLVGAPLPSAQITATDEDYCNKGMQTSQHAGDGIFAPTSIVSTFVAY
jgi:hypothetical protein